MKKSYFLSSIMLVTMSLLPLVASAHTGVSATSGFNAGFVHPFSGIEHLLAMFAVGLWATQKRGAAVWLVPSAFVLVMLLGGLGGVAGMQLPLVEQGIVLSVLLLGVLLATAIKLPAMAGALLVAVFAGFHGYAHGAEMPQAMSAVGYSAGFILATIVLHVAGIACGCALRKVNADVLMRYAGGAIALCGVYLAAA